MATRQAEPQGLILPPPPGQGPPPSADAAREWADTLLDGIDPRKAIALFKELATALMEFIEASPEKVIVEIKHRDKQTGKIIISKHLKYEAWSALASFTGGVPSTAPDGVWRFPEDPAEPVRQYRAEGVLIRRSDGMILSRAYAMCSRGEPRWAQQPEFSLLSMAQTRAAAKACRMVLSPIVILRGFSPTPLEEMEEEEAAAQASQHGAKPEVSPAVKPAGSSAKALEPPDPSLQPAMRTPSMATTTAEKTQVATESAQRQAADMRAHDKAVAAREAERNAPLQVNPGEPPIDWEGKCVLCGGKATWLRVGAKGGFGACQVCKAIYRPETGLWQKK